MASPLPCPDARAVIAAALILEACGNGTGGATSSDAGARHFWNVFLDTIHQSPGCLPRVLIPQSDGTVPCVLLEATPRPTPCTAETGRAPADPRYLDPVRSRLKQTGLCDAPGLVACNAYSVCELVQAGFDSGCHEAAPYSGPPRWCYVDPADCPAVDDPSLVASCPPTERRILRFVDPKSQTPAADAQLMISCSQILTDLPPVCNPSGDGGRTAP